MGSIMPKSDRRRRSAGFYEMGPPFVAFFKNGARHILCQWADISDGAGGVAVKISDTDPPTELPDSDLQFRIPKVRRILAAAETHLVFGFSITLDPRYHPPSGLIVNGDYVWITQGPIIENFHETDYEIFGGRHGIIFSGTCSPGDRVYVAGGGVLTTTPNASDVCSCGFGLETVDTNGEGPIYFQMAPI